MPAAAGKGNPMSETLMRCLVIFPLVFLAGAVDAVAGGGGLISLPAYLISGLPVHLAIGTNKLSAGMGTALATWRYAKSGYIPWRESLCCALCTLAGSAGGAKLALLLDDRIFKIVMLVILPLTGLYVLRGKSLKTEQAPLPPRKTLLLSMGIALVIGVYDGFYGPGTGTFLLLGLTGLAHWKLQEANGLTKAVNLTTNVTALTVFLLHGAVLLPLGLAAGAFSIAGNYLGTRIFDRGGARAIKPIIMVVLSIFFIKVLWEVLT